MSRSFSSRVLLAGCLIVVLAGCSKGPQRPPTFPVTGTITWKGKPLEAARIVLVPQTEKVEGCAGISDVDGKFQITTFNQGDGAQAGEYKVNVSKYDPKAQAQQEREKVRDLTYEEEQKIYAPDEKPTPPAKNMLPKKYENETTSNITLKVTDQPATLDIVLE